MGKTRKESAFQTREGLGLEAASVSITCGPDAAFDDVRSGHLKLELSREHSHLSASVSCQPRAALVSSRKDGAVGRSSRGGGSVAEPGTRHAEDAHQSSMAQVLNFCKFMFAGAMSAVVSRTVVAPFERVKIDILLQNSTGTSIDTAARILRTEGILGFWKGHGLNIMRTAPYKAVNFTSYEVFSHALQGFSEAWASPEDAERMKNVARFTAGALAGISATVICFPLDVLRVRMMAPGGSPYGGVIATAKGMFQHEGIGRFYTGVLPAVVSMAPAGAVFYGVYDVLKDWELQRAAAAQGLDSTEGMQLEPATTLLFGGLSGAAAEGSVYPLEVVRRRMQVLIIQKGPQYAAASRRPFGLMQVSAQSVLEQQGFRGFYSGVVPSIIQVCTASAAWDCSPCCMCCVGPSASKPSC
mmetsp:Transcript_21455/g.59586  ORF Transcript_21455/g.59586 Transcript_21455/m.59586 type:complete len:413 (-) Transcript_21455:143-1381(-)